MRTVLLLAALAAGAALAGCAGSSVSDHIAGEPPVSAGAAPTVTSTGADPGLDQVSTPADLPADVARDPGAPAAADATPTPAPGELLGPDGTDTTTYPGDVP